MCYTVCMKKHLLSVLLVLFSCGGAWAAGLKLSIACDRPDHLYACGEKAVYTVTVTEANGARPAAGVIEARLDNFGPQVIASAKWDLAATNRFTLAGVLTEPGFLRLTVKAPKTAPAVWAVAYEPEKIRKGSPSPADFDAFWAEARKKLARDVPPDMQLTRIDERSTATFDFFRISFATFGRRVYGYLTVPTDKARAPFPVHVEVNAAGFGAWTNDLQGHPDRICVRFSVHPFDMDWRWKEKGMKADYDALHADAQKRFGAKNWYTAGITEGRDVYVYYSALLGIDRAVDWVAARPDVDRTRFWYSGTSQGGGFGFYLCGLNKAFTRAVFYVPAITDTMGYLAGRDSGWPKIVENNSSSPEKRAAAEKWAPYYDGANFAARITCPVCVVVGFADLTCPPCAVYAAYNAIPSSEKKILHGFGMGHRCRSDLYTDGRTWLEKGAARK